MKKRFVVRKIRLVLSLPLVALLAAGADAQLSGGVPASGTATANPACAKSIRDVSTGACLKVDSIPTIGRLFPLGLDLYIDAVSRNVGIGTITPLEKLSVAGTIESTSGGIRFPDGSIQQSAAWAARGRTQMQLATLRWYDVNLAGNIFPTGLFPVSIVFDGASLWVSNTNGVSLTKLRASDGANLGTFPTGGTGPLGLAFDGSSIWVSNVHTDDLTRLRASDGVFLGTYPLGTQPGGAVFDGWSIWVTNSASSSVTRLRASDGANLGTFPVGGSGAHAIAFDGSNIWVSNPFSNTVSKL